MMGGVLKKMGIRPVKLEHFDPLQASVAVLAARRAAKPYRCWRSISLLFHIRSKCLILPEFNREPRIPILVTTSFLPCTRPPSRPGKYLEHF